MPERVPYEYAVVRVVPRVDATSSLTQASSSSPSSSASSKPASRSTRTACALWPSVDIPTIRQHLDAIQKICSGDSTAGPIARMSQSERFHWLTTPRSTVIQTSPIRTGLSSNLEQLPDDLERKVVERASAD